MINVPRAERYNFFVGNLVIRNAVIGIMIPIHKEYPLLNHCPVDAEMFNSLIICGSPHVRAVDIIDDAKHVIIIFINISVLFLSVSCSDLDIDFPIIKIPLY